jgi:hypothetical protein
MEESGKSSRGFRKKPSNCQTSTETCRHQVNERSVWLPQRSMKVNWQPHVFHLHNKNLIWKPCFHTDMKTSRSIVCQTNMHLIMRIENAFKFCGFTFTTNGFLFFFIVKMENVGLSVDFHWTLWKSNRPLIYLMSAGFAGVAPTWTTTYYPVE